MTTIAVNRDEIAGDLQMTNGTMKFKIPTKLYKFSAHQDHYPHCDFMVGFTGTASDMVMAAQYFDYPETFPKGPPVIKGLQGLVLTMEGNIFLFDDYRKWIRSNDRFLALGSGAHIALGAMENGATPTEAVKAAIKRDIYTGYGVKTLKRI